MGSCAGARKREKTKNKKIENKKKENAPVDSLEAHHNTLSDREYTQRSASFLAGRL